MSERKRAGQLMASLKIKRDHVLSCYSDASTTLYDMIGDATEALKDLDWIALVHKGYEVRARDAIEKEIFSEIPNCPSLGTMIAMRREIDKKRWEEYDYDLAAIFTIYEDEYGSKKKRKPEQAKPTTVPKPTVKELQAEMAEARVKAKEQLQAARKEAQKKKEEMQAKMATEQRRYQEERYKQEEERRRYQEELRQEQLRMAEERRQLEEERKEQQRRVEEAEKHLEEVQQHKVVAAANSISDQQIAGLQARIRQLTAENERLRRQHEKDVKTMAELRSALFAAHQQLVVVNMTQRLVQARPGQKPKES